MQLDYAVLARKAFETYKAQRRTQGEEPEYENFEDQPDYLQDSGIQEVADMEHKVEMVGCAIVEDDGAVQGMISEFPESLIEELSAYEHARWMEERIGNGWVYGPVKDIGKKEHPSLVPWDELPQSEKDKDRRVVRNVIPFFRDLGYAVVARV